ncbi:MAG: tetratricopeptide repeat protein [Ignavibacteria bacterium]|nr:tetratricopeptide repeat protein [Ignavibacteria bacterium]
MPTRRFQRALAAGLAFAILVGVIGCAKELSEQEILEKAIDHQRNREYDDALASFQMLVDRFPKSPNAPEALYAMGLIYQDHKRDFVKADTVFKRLVDSYPDDPTASGAAYLRAVLLWRDLKRPNEAQKAYEEFLKRYPNAAMASSGRAELDSLMMEGRKKK